MKVYPFWLCTHFFHLFNQKLWIFFLIFSKYKEILIHWPLLEHFWKFWGAENYILKKFILFSNYVNRRRQQQWLFPKNTSFSESPTSILVCKKIFLAKQMKNIGDMAKSILLQKIQKTWIQYRTMYTFCYILKTSWEQL